MVKLGMTIHPVHRMSVYNTGDAPGIGLEKRYDGIWQVNANSTSELRSIERHLHARFCAQRQKKANGTYSEWFTLNAEDVNAFLTSQPYIIRAFSIEEIRIIHEKATINLSSPEDMTLFNQEMQLDIQTPPTLKEEFFETFLGINPPRRIQNELWTLWEEICRSDSKYRGIVQWATGTGKTIALLMLIVLSADACKQRGILFRGLLIAPKNDIFNTIIHHIRKLSTWGIVVCEGHNAQLSSLQIPRDVPILLTATHASLTEVSAWESIPSMNLCHYDEVHRSTGNEFYTLFNEYLHVWDTKYLTGTSATPRTCALSQNKKISELFGNPIQMLHKCDVDEAITEGWIAKPRFCVNIISNRASRKDVKRAFVDIVHQSILDKKAKGGWVGGKVIAYLSSRAEVCDAVAFAKEQMSEWHIYTAVDDADAAGDDAFVQDMADGQPRILFACERYREGSDIKGLEMTCILMGNTIGANILLQIAGRALRNDYEGKEGWCTIVRPSDEGTSEDDVFDSIILEIMEFMGKDTTTTPPKQRIKQIVENFFGSVAISGKVYNVSETIHRIQSMYARNAFERSDPKEKYQVIRALNNDLGILSKDDYEQRASEHSKYIEDPKSYFNLYWVSWYHFLGIDTRAFPQTKHEWIRVCKCMGLTTWSEYKQRNSSVLPTNPSEMYEDYTNWDKEFGLTEEDD
jgi:hypothetical protein